MGRLLLTSAWLLGLTATAAEPEAKPPPGPPPGAPAYQAPPRPDDGTNLALTVTKLEHGFDPPRPFLIWAVGSSFTNGLGDGSVLTALLRERFPNAPPIVYKRMAGNSTPYHLNRGWIRHLVIPEQPDLVLLYNYGKTADLEQLIIELRQRTTTDIVVGSLHWCVPHRPLWPDPERVNSHQDPVALRAMCQKYGVEFVENRRELTDYLLANNLAFDALLADSVHETPYAAIMTNMNIARHLHRPAKFAYAPETRECRIAAATRRVKRDGKWTKAEGVLTTAAAGRALTVRFTGNRIELIGRRAPDGGSAEIQIDGRPADQADVFYAGYIKPDEKNAPAPPNPPRDRAPHRVVLGTGIVPQAWIIRMTSDTGDYELTGSVTGPDGKGNARQPFTSTSGQIGIEPEFWRQPDTNRTGDTFTFDVWRCATGTVSFKGDPATFRLALVQNLPSGPHALRLVARGDGPVTVAAFDVFEPPLR